MDSLEMIFAFIFAMTILMIPILAIVRRTPKKALSENAELSRRISELERGQLERDQELALVKKDLSFMQRLLEDGTRRG